VNPPSPYAQQTPRVEKGEPVDERKTGLDETCFRARIGVILEAGGALVSELDG
jgi:hypothetical protein